MGCIILQVILTEWDPEDEHGDTKKEDEQEVVAVAVPAKPVYVKPANKYDDSSNSGSPGPNPAKLFASAATKFTYLFPPVEDGSEGSFAGGLKVGCGRCFFSGG
jgi:hypothetical protein